MLRILQRLLLLLGSAGTIWISGFLLFTACIPDRVAEPDRTTDAIVALTGGSLRIDEGVRLLQRGLAPRLFVSGVGKGVTLPELLASQAPDHPAWQLTDGRIELGRTAATTAGNAEESAAWVKANGLRSIRLVTSDYHILRSLREFHTLMPDVTVVPHPVFAEHIRTHEWWKHPGTAVLLFIEYHKFLMSYVYAITGIRLTDTATQTELLP